MKRNNRLSRVVGLTGTIASGKSAAAQYLTERFGIPCLDADKVGHEVLREEAVKIALTGRFGADILGEDGEIIRAALAEKAFADDENRLALNAITHPVIIGHIEEWVDKARGLGKPFVVIEAIELTTTSLKELCDEVWVVYASPETRLKRLTAERNMSEEAARARMEAQRSDEEFLAAADETVLSEPTLRVLYKRLRALTRKMKRLSRRPA